MSTDLDVVRKIEQSIGRELKQSEEIDFEYGENSYVVDRLGCVIGIGLCNSGFKNLELLIELENLQGLDLYGTGIEDISALVGLKNIRRLDLGNNQITDYSFLESLTSLTSLDLRSNQITDCSFLENLTSLTSLDLSGNQINVVEKFIIRLSMLRKLDLSSNSLTILPPDIIQMGMDIKWSAYEDGICLMDNPLEQPPVEIVQQGTEAVRAYFASLEDEKQALNEVKVLFVGEGASGKTSLIKRLFGEGFDPHEPMTHGIKIRDWHVAEAGEPIKVRMWDFGGQEIMHATHQFFLSKRSLYILVLDGRKEEKIEYWLKHIESFGGDSPVLVVINKIDRPGARQGRTAAAGSVR